MNEIKNGPTVEVSPTIRDLGKLPYLDIIKNSLGLQDSLIWVLALYSSEFEVDESEILQWILEAGVKSLLAEAVTNGCEVPLFDGHISSDIDLSVTT